MDRHDDSRRPRDAEAPSENPAPADLDAIGRRVAELEDELAAAREEARQNHDRWVRERADLENQRKRAARERLEATRYGNEMLIRDLLPVVDNLERAVQAAEEGGNRKPLVEGVLLVLKAFHDILERHGVERVAAHGTPFDPTHHEAVEHVESRDHAPNLVIAEHQPGYRLHDRLLRPALVTVSKGSPQGGPDLANEGGGD